MNTPNCACLLCDFGSICYHLQSLQISFFFFQAEDGIRDVAMTGVQTCALPILARAAGNLERRLVELQDVPEALARAELERSEERRVGEEGRSRWSPDH